LIRHQLQKKITNNVGPSKYSDG